MSWARHEQARELGSLPADAILRLIIDSESGKAALPTNELKKLSRLVEEVSERLAHGGVLRLAAAGPVAHLVSFATEETGKWFPGVIPVEAMIAVDDATEEAAVELVEKVVAAEDVVLGVSRSGGRPWTCMVMRKANLVGALTASISCVPDNPMSRECDMPVVVPCDAEVVMGSMQFGAATIIKVLLDGILLALAANAGGLFGDVPIRANVGADAWRLVAAAAPVDHLRARSLVAAAEGDVRVAVVMGRLDVDVDEARRRLEQAGGRLSDALSAAGASG